MNNVYQMVTDRIIAEMEKGIIPWERPWTGTADGAYSRSTGKPYSLLNQMLLGKPGEYLTYKQATDEGGHVKKGEKGHTVVFWKMLRVEENGDNGEKVERNIPVLRYYTVFHVDQCEGIAPKYNRPVSAVAAEPIEAAETVINDYRTRSGVKLQHVRGNRACYSPASDQITLPMRDQFPEIVEMYSTLFHEAVHSTGHASRLNRITRPAAFGTEDYSKEELVAEMGAAMLMHRCGIDKPKTIRNSAAYLQSWIRALRDDVRLIVSAASRAEKALNYILGESPAETDERASA